jgi:hypothetical protein
VKNVLTLLVVLYVKHTELKIHQLVHVKLNTWNAMMMDLVVNVNTHVKNVLHTMIMPMVHTVLFVLMEELTIHHLVLVHMELLKSVKNVFHVTKRDVKPVPEMLIIVMFVKLTEFNLHQNVHVTLDIMKMKTKIVNNVTLIVTLVLTQPITV